VTVLIVIILTLVLFGGAAVVFTPDPRRQAVTLSIYGILLTVLFMAAQGPDVALSQLAVGTAFVPLMVLLALRTMRGRPDKPGGQRGGRR
jgi:energy-converting hydrogenase B subunit D